MTVMPAVSRRHGSGESKNGDPRSQPTTIPRWETVLCTALNRHCEEVRKMANQYPESDPRHHAANVQEMLSELIDHLRDDVTKFDEPKAQALFETGAEVLIGLRTAFEHYESQAEPALRPSR